MKNIIKLGFLSIVAFALLSACNQDNLRTNPVDEAREAAFSFFQPNIVSELLAADNGIIRIILTRTDNSVNAVVPIEMTATAAVKSIFTLTTPVVNFNAGEYTATAIVGFGNIERLQAGVQYRFTLAFANENETVSIGGSNKADIVASRKLTFVKVEAPGTFSSVAFGGAWACDILRAIEAPNFYKLSDFFVNDILFAIDPVAGTAVIPFQPLGEDIFGAGSNSWIECLAGTYANGVCVFGGGTWNNAYYTSQAANSGYRMTNERIILPPGSY